MLRPIAEYVDLKECRITYDDAEWISPRRYEASSIQQGRREEGFSARRIVDKS
jgi:hypothetical protein